MTDLDGTLLGHDDYQYEILLPCLADLEKKGVPVILNTSKTYAEVSIWRERLGNHHPFVVENGSAIYFPENYFAELPPGTESSPNGHRLVLGKEISELAAYYASKNPEAISFVHCEEAIAKDLTDLPTDDLKRARTREFSLPLSFQEPELATSFADTAEQDGFLCLRGGRFTHLQGVTDKGKALQILKVLYAENGQGVFTIALGDNQNDRAMLEAADQPIIVRSKANLEIAHNSVYTTRQPAPEGWLEGIEFALGLTTARA